MSTELERRLKVLEKRIAHATPCAHALPILINPTEAEIDQMAETLATCPNCLNPPAFGVTMVILRTPAGRSKAPSPLH